MKKILIFGVILTLLIVGGAVAGTFATKTDAQNALSTYKVTRQSNIDKLASTVDYTTDKECILDYDTGETRECRVCLEFEFTYDETRYGEETCIKLPEGTTLEQDQALIQEYVVSVMEHRIPKVEHSYTERSMTGSLEVSR